MRTTAGGLGREPLEDNLQSWRQEQIGLAPKKSSQEVMYLNIEFLGNRKKRKHLGASQARQLCLFYPLHDPSVLLIACDIFPGRTA